MSCPTLPKTGSMQSGTISRRRTSVPATDAHAYSCWPTAQAGDGEKMSHPRHAGDRTLPSAGRNWQTPNSRDADKWNRRPPGSGHNQNLSGQVLSRFASAGQNSEDSYDALGRQCIHFSLLGPETPLDGDESSSDAPTTPRRYLNPRFVEWLMGLPARWTGCGCSAMELCRYRQRMRSALCALLRRTTRSKRERHNPRPAAAWEDMPAGASEKPHSRTENPKGCLLADAKSGN
jgi:hypothetical protein